MQRSVKIFIVFLIFGIPLYGQVNFSIIREWKINGPYEGKGNNSLYLDFLKEFGGENSINSKNIFEWETLKADSNGYLNLSEYEETKRGRQIYYLYSEVNSNEEKNLALTVGYTGGLRIWINGQNIYSNQISRKPIPDNDIIAVKFHKGANDILVKAEGRGDYFGFYFRLYEYVGNIFVNEARIICPDFRIGHKLRRWGQAEVLNTGKKKISEINLTVEEDSLMINSSQSAYDIMPGETRLIPFLVSVKKDVPDVKSISFNLKLTLNGKEKTIVVQPHIRNEDNYFVTTYRSKLDGSVQPYSVLLPKSFNPTKEYPLVMLLHGAWVTNWGQNMISYDAKKWIIHAAVHDRGNNRYREIGEVDLIEVIEDVKKHYKINEGEIYLAGHSMGGYGTYFQAVRHPDKWNAISPQAGYTDYFLYRDKERMSEFKKKLFEEWSPLLYAENLLHVPAFIVHGEVDDNVPVEHDREMSARLEQLGYNFIYDENPGKGHWWGPRGEDYGVEVVDKPAIWNFLRKFEVREKYPKKVVYKTNTLRYNNAYWVTINEMDSIYSMAKITAEISEPNTFRIKINNIKQFTLSLNDSLINFNEPLKIFVNSDLVFDDLISGSTCISIKKSDKGQFEILFDYFDLLRRNSGKEKIRDKYVLGKLNENGKVENFSAVNKKGIEKNHDIFGPVIDAFNSSFLFVTGESKDEEFAEAIKFCANSMARELEIRSQGNVIIENSKEVTPYDILNKNLILFGSGESNEIISQINQELPIKFDDKKITAGSKEFSDEGAGFIEVYPNPLNPKKYVVIVGGTDAASFMNATKISFEGIPDYVIFNSDSFDEANIEFISAGFFNKNWEMND